MLENLTKKMTQVVIGALVILLGVVMALQFGGPQAEGCSAGGASFAAEVYGDTITEGEFDAAYRLAGFDRQTPDTARNYNLREHTLNGLIERNLLAREARDVGFHVTKEDVWQKLIDDGTAYLSLGVDAPANLPSGEVPVPVRDQDGNFDQEGAKRFIQYGLRRSVAEFAEAQIEEALAQRMRELVLSTVEVSPQEVWDAFVRERERAQVSYVRFSPSYYRDRIEPTEADVRAWMEENAEAVDREYQANRHRYTGLEEQVRPAHILVQADPSAGDEVKQAARERAEAYKRRLEGGAEFEQLARQASEDVHSGRRGGDLGWNPRGRLPAEFDEVGFAMGEGQVSDVGETPRGGHIIKLLGKREGDVPEAEAKLEIAERLYREARSRSLAREAAEEALAKLRGGMTLEELGEELRREAAGDEQQAAAGDQEGQEGQEDQEEELPPEEPDDPLTPHVEESRSFARGGQPVTASYDTSALATEAFELSEEEPLPEEPLEMGSEYYVYKLQELQLATEEDFTDDVRQRIRSGLRRAKEREAMRLYLHRLRERAVADGALRINEAVLRYGEDEELEGEGEEPAEG